MITRVITALVLFAFLAVLISSPNWIMVLVCEVIVFIGVYEWSKISKMNEIEQGITMLLFMLFTIISVTNYLGVFELMGIFGIFNLLPFLTISNIFKLQNLIIITVAIFWLTYAPYALYKKVKINVGLKSRFFGFYLFSGVVLSLIFLIDHSIKYLLITMAITIIGDIAAFFIGKYFGQLQLTIISPKKTYEGLVAGLIGVIFIGSFLITKYLGIYWVTAIFISLFTGIAAVFGDLFISLAKRWAGVKDSGKILPGHGGILDRIDSLLAALPVFATLIILLS